jgi:hypothetical protein
VTGKAVPYLVVVAVLALVWGLAAVGIWLIESAPWWAGIAAAWMLVACCVAWLLHLVMYDVDDEETSR